MLYRIGRPSRFYIGLHLCELDIFSTSIHREIRHQQLGPLLDQNTRWQELPWGQALPSDGTNWRRKCPKNIPHIQDIIKPETCYKQVFENIGTSAGAKGKRLAARRKEIVRDRAPWSEQPLEEVTDHLCNLKSERFRVTPLKKVHFLYKSSQADNIQQPSTPLIAQGDPPSSFLWPEAMCNLKLENFWVTLLN